MNKSVFIYTRNEDGKGSIEAKNMNEMDVAIILEKLQIMSTELALDTKEIENLVDSIREEPVAGEC